MNKSFYVQSAKIIFVFPKFKIIFGTFKMTIFPTLSYQYFSLLLIDNIFGRLITKEKAIKKEEKNNQIFYYTIKAVLDAPI